MEVLCVNMYFLMSVVASLSDSLPETFAMLLFLFKNTLYKISACLHHTHQHHTAHHLPDIDSSGAARTQLLKHGSWRWWRRSWCSRRKTADCESCGLSPPGLPPPLSLSLSLRHSYNWLDSSSSAWEIVAATKVYTRRWHLVNNFRCGASLKILFISMSHWVERFNTTTKFFSPRAEVKIYKRKQESKKKKKTRTRPRKRPRKKEKNFLFFLITFLIKNRIAFKIWTAVRRVEKYKIGAAGTDIRDHLLYFISQRFIY